MTGLMDDITIGAAFARAVATYADRPFLAVPTNPARPYLQQGLTLTFAQAATQVDALKARYTRAGYGHGSRVATLMENHPAFVLHKLALNSLGACCVPINPDYRAGETAYLMEHSRPDLVLAVAWRRGQIEEALAQSSYKPPLVVIEDVEADLPDARRPLLTEPISPATPASILYTSGTTGRPKGCVLSNGYEMSCGGWYANLDGIAALRPGEDRIYNPLPLYHINAGVLSLLGVMVAGLCQIMPDRFHPHRWWTEIIETEASVAHYLGVIAAMLNVQPPSPLDRAHKLRFALGAGIAGLAGCALSQVGNVGPDLGQGYIVDSFMVVVLGGVGQLAGTVYAALGLGIVNKLLEGVAGAVLAKIMVLVLIVVFIQKRPQGLFALKGRSAEA